jgi:transcription initiation factor TFIIE subunit alpha
MTKKKPAKKLTAFQTVNEFLARVGGEGATELVSLYEKGFAPIKDEEMAEKMKVKVTDVRTILNRLHYRGVANYQKKRNKKTGWYSYTWTIDQKRILELLIEKQKEEIEKMEQKKEHEETYSFFACKKSCHEFPFEIAAEYQFRCPDCGSELNSIDGRKRSRGLTEQVGQMKKEIEEFSKLI